MDDIRFHWPRAIAVNVMNAIIAFVWRRDGQIGGASSEITMTVFNFAVVRHLCSVIYEKHQWTVLAPDTIGLVVSSIAQFTITNVGVFPHINHSGKYFIWSGDCMKGRSWGLVMDLAIRAIKSACVNSWLGHWHYNGLCLQATRDYLVQKVI